MKHLLFVSAFMAGLFIVPSCQNKNTSTNNKTINETISVDDFEKKLSALTNVQLVDVRTPEEYQQGHLKGAVNYNINGDAFDEQLKKLDISKPVMVYCLGGGRSAAAAEKMQEMGFTEVYNMSGGIMKWNAANKPIDNSNAAPEPTGMSMNDFNSKINTDKYVLVDYRAKWCKPCVKMAPMLETLAEKKKDKMILLMIDADENKKLLKEKGIEGIPYLELYKDGKLIWKHDGYIEENILLNETKL